MILTIWKGKGEEKGRGEERPEMIQCGRISTARGAPRSRGVTGLDLNRFGFSLRFQLRVHHKVGYPKDSNTTVLKVSET